MYLGRPNKTNELQPTSTEFNSFCACDTQSCCKQHISFRSWNFGLSAAISTGKLTATKFGEHNVLA